MEFRLEKLKGLTRLVLLFIPFTLAYPIPLHNLSILAFFILAIIGYYQNLKPINSFKANPLYWLITPMLLISCIGLLYTSNIKQGLAEMERAAYPLALAIIFLFAKDYTEGTNDHLKSFSIGCFLITLIAFVTAWTSLESREFYSVLKTGHISLTKFIGIQPLYLSVFFIIIAFYLLEKLRLTLHGKSFLKLSLILITLVLAVVLVFFLRSKTALLILPTLFIIYLVIVFKKRGWWLAFILLLTTLLTFLIDKGGPPKFINSYGRTVSQAFDQRLLIWRGAIEAIKHTPIWGAGTGDVQASLNKGYEMIGYQEGITNSYNAHNQYLQFMARNGLVELLYFMALLFYSFWKSTQQSNYTFLMFNILISLVMLTESFLSVQKGIAFFYFFLFAFLILSEPKQAEQEN